MDDYKPGCIAVGVIFGLLVGFFPSVFGRFVGGLMDVVVFCFEFLFSQSVLVGAAILLSFMGLIWAAYATNCLMQVERWWDGRDLEKLSRAYRLHLFATPCLLITLFMLFLMPFSGILFNSLVAMLLSVKVILSVVAFNEDIEDKIYRGIGTWLLYAIAVYLPTWWALSRLEGSSPYYLIGAQTLFFTVLFPGPVLLLRKRWLDHKKRLEKQQRIAYQDQQAKQVQAEQQKVLTVQQNRQMEQQAKDDLEATLWREKVSFELPQPLNNQYGGHRSFVETEMRSLPKHVDFRTPAANISHEEDFFVASQIYAHYRRAIIAYCQWRLSAGEDRDDFFESLKPFLARIRVPNFEAEAATISRLASVELDAEAEKIARQRAEDEAKQEHQRQRADYERELEAHKAKRGAMEKIFRERIKDEPGMTEADIEQDVKKSLAYWDRENPVPQQVFDH